MGRRFHRHLDEDLIAKMEGGWRPKDSVQPLKKQKPPRHASTYRGARRNAMRNKSAD